MVGIPSLDAVDIRMLLLETHQSEQLLHLSLLASAAISFLVQVNIDGIGEITTVFLALLLGKGIPGNHLKRLFNIDALLGAGFKVRHLASRLTILLCTLLTDHPSILAHIDLVAQHHEGETLRVAGRGLDQELITPAVECFEGFRAVDVVDQDAAVGTSVEGYSQGLETLLPGSVPKLEGHDAVVDSDFLGQKVGADRGFVGGGELLVDL